MRLPSGYLYRLGQRYYFRRRIPSDVARYFPRDEIRKCLRTPKREVAEPLARAWAHHAELLFLRLRAGVLTEEQAGRTVSHFLQAEREGGYWGEAASDVLDGGPSNLSAEFDRSTDLKSTKG